MIAKSSHSAPTFKSICKVMKERGNDGSFEMKTLIQMTFIGLLLAVSIFAFFEGPMEYLGYFFLIFLTLPAIVNLAVELRASKIVLINRLNNSSELQEFADFMKNDR